MSKTLTVFILQWLFSQHYPKPHMITGRSFWSLPHCILSCFEERWHSQFFMRVVNIITWRAKKCLVPGSMAEKSQSSFSLPQGPLKSRWLWPFCFYHLCPSPSLNLIPVQSLVGELRSWKVHSMVKKIKGWWCLSCIDWLWRLNLLISFRNTIGKYNKFPTYDRVSFQEHIRKSNSFLSPAKLA